MIGIWINLSKSSLYLSDVRSCPHMHLCMCLWEWDSYSQPPKIWMPPPCHSIGISKDPEDLILYPGLWQGWVTSLDCMAWWDFFFFVIVPVCFCYLDLIYSFLPLVFLVFKCFVNWSKRIHLINLLFMVISQTFSWNHNYFTCSFSCQNVERVLLLIMLQSWVPILGISCYDAGYFHLQEVIALS